MTTQIKIENFEGISFFEGDIGNSIITGGNGKGKTGILSAVLWIFSDSNLKGSSDIKVQQGGKYLDLETRVELKHGELHLCKVQKEKWQKDRQTREKKLTGNETTYFLSGKKIKWKEYKQIIESYQIDGLSIKESFMSMMIPGYFPVMLDEKKREAVVYDQIASVSVEEVAEKIKMPEHIDWYKSLDDPETERQELVTASNELDKEADRLKSKKEENESKTIDDLLSLEEINKQKSHITAEIDKLDVIINTDSTKALRNEIESEKTKYISNYMSRKTDFDISEKKRVADLEEKANKERNSIIETNNKIKEENKARKELFKKQKESNDELLTKIAEKEADIETLRSNFLEEKNKVFDGFNCPILKNECETLKNSEDIAGLEAEFNIKKSEKMTEINQKGKKLTEEIKELQKKIVQLKDPGELPTVEVPEKKTFEVKEFSENIDTSSFEKRIAELEAKKEDKTEYIQKKEELTKKKEELIKLENQHEERAKTEKRIKELTSQIAEKDADYKEKQRKISFIKKFAIQKAKMLEGDAKEKFGLSVKLFDFQYNGIPVNCCKFLDEKGVEFESINTASESNLGIFICEKVQEIVNADLPILADNLDGVEKKNIRKTEKTFIGTKMVEGQEIKIKKMEK